MTLARAPCLLVIRDGAGARFGGYSSAPLQLGPRWFGGSNSFLFRADGAGGVLLHRATGANANFVYMNAHREMLPNGITFGGDLDSRHFGLWLEDSLDTGRAEETCSTYDLSHSLASSAGFAVDHVEVWAVCEGARNPWLAAGGEEEGGGATSDAHKETREFLALAGREVNRAQALEPFREEEEEGRPRAPEKWISPDQ